MSIPQGYHIKTKKKGSFKPFNCLLISVVLTIVVLATLFVFFQSWYVKGISRATSDDSTTVDIVIEPGSTPDQIGELLFTNGLITDKTLWSLYIKINNIGPKLLADRYSIPKNLTMQQISDTLQRPPEKQFIWITFPEGITYKEMANIIKDELPRFSGGNLKIEEFLRIAEFPDSAQFENEEVKSFLTTYKPQGVSLEGFLYPNTYPFESDMNALEVIEFILGEFINQTRDLNLDGSDLDFYDALVLASIVESESFGDDDREIIAGVFKNRLDIDMALQADSTINYITGKKDARATLEDLEINSPYNTYKFTGLPPTPIKNPRKEALAASLNPPATEYLFFIHDEDGTAYYAKTAEEHFENVNRYLDN